MAEEASKPISTVSDSLLESVLVKSPIGSVENHGAISDKEKELIADALKDLRRFKHYEEDIEDDPSSKKHSQKKGNPHSKVVEDSGKSGSKNLSDYVNAEMAELTLELKMKEKHEKEKDTGHSVEHGRKKIASISEDMQSEFLESYKDMCSNIAKKAENVDVHEMKSNPFEHGADKNVMKDVVREVAHDGRPKQVDGAEDSSKKTPKKKKDKKKGNTPEQDASPALGSYSQLLRTMGRQDQKSPRSKNQRMREEVEALEAALHAAVPELAMYEDKAQMSSSSSDMIQPSRNKKKKDRKAKNQNQQPEFVFQELPNQPGQGKKQKYKQQKDGNPELSHPQGERVDSRPDSGNRQGKKKKQKYPQEPAFHRQVSSESSPAGSSGRPLKGKGRSTDDLQAQMPALPVHEETTMEVTVPKAEHMFVVGPQGQHLSDILKLTGVTITVPPFNSPLDKVVLKGGYQQLSRAFDMMISKSQEAQKAFLQGYIPGQMSGQCQRGKKGQRPKEGETFHVNDDGLDLDVNTEVKDSHTAQRSNAGQGQRSQTGQTYRKSDNQRKSDNPNWRKQDQHYSSHHGKGQQYKGQRTSSQPEVKGQVQNKGQAVDQGQGAVAKSQGKRQRKRQNVFTEYLPREEVSAGLKRGILVEGPIRINPKNYEEGYVPHPDGVSDILIGSFKHRNRALNGDVVAVEIFGEGDWKFNKEELAGYELDLKAHEKVHSDDEVLIEAEEIIEIADKGKADANQPDTSSQTVENSDQKLKTGSSTPSKTPKKERHSKGEKSKECNFSPSKRYTSLNDVMSVESPLKKHFGSDKGKEQYRQMLQRTGKVVAIIEEKHSRACTGQIRPMLDKYCGYAMFAPNDHRMPRMMIPITDCPKDFLERPEDHSRTLYVGRVTDWRVDSMMADGRLARSLGEAGEIEPETEGMLIENGVDFEEFPQQALDCLPQNLPWSIPEEEFEEREDFRKCCIFTIDPATARDLDDALSCEDLGNGRYKVGVHIADVSYFVEEGTVLDNIAGLRSTSVYLVHKVIPMLPRLLCEKLCSLNPDEDRLTFSVQWTITEQGEIEEEWFGRSIIRSCVKLAYDHAQGFIEEPDRAWKPEELPQISEGFTVEDIKKRVLNLHKIALNLRKGRFDSGALRLDQVKLQYSLDSETGMPNGYTVYQQRDSNRLVEEFMLLANMAVAHRINREFPDKALLRRHPPPQSKMLENLSDQCSALGIHIDTSSAGAFQRSLLNYSGDDDYASARMQVLVALCAKPMQNARYFCTGCIDDESLYHHYALNVPLYTHFTSPIRRYPDILVHRLLAASLDYCPEPSKSPGDIHKLADNANDKKTAAKRVGDLSSDLFFSVFVKTAGPLEERAMVMGVMDKSFDIFVLRLGVTKRVYCDKLPLKEKIFRRERKVPSLVLVWAEENGEPEVRQEISIFSLVDAVLAVGDQPLMWTAVIKRPQFSVGMEDFLQCNPVQPNEETSLEDQVASLNLEDNNGLVTENSASQQDSCETSQLTEKPSENVSSEP
ncbi:DIS3-like exonuclease 2 [Mya arenaria]|uniref:DIS3-like exonuclease 2 n=1 Tax=Mya arenaria TaxID=6604 RepID=UPI0022E43CFF|nr:DIS3-like exonuclease 2 [Mya arenaria]